MTEQAIPLGWIKKYTEELLAAAKLVGPESKMGQATLLRVDHIMDMVKAWKGIR